MTNFKKKYFLKKVYKNSTHHFHDRRGLSKELLVKLDLTSSIYTLFLQDNQFQEHFSTFFVGSGLPFGRNSGFIGFILPYNLHRQAKGPITKKYWDHKC